MTRGSALAGIVAAISFLGTSGVPADDSPTVKAPSMYWIFLTSGKATAGVAKEEVARMQKEHLANFGRLAGEDKLLTAGPMRDPEGKLRGIVVVSAGSADALRDYFRPDPYVEGGFMKVEEHRVEFLHGAIKTKITPQALEEFRMVLVTAPAPPAATAPQAPNDARGAVFEALLKHCEDRKADGTLRLAGRFVDGSPRQGVLIFHGIEDAALEEQLKSAPPVLQGALSFRVLPLYIGAGTLD